jgi:hypothetical protein
LALFFQMAVNLWKQGHNFAAVNSSGWDRERAQIEEWWRILAMPVSRRNGVIEFSTGSFWSGYYTYASCAPVRAG